MKINEKSFTVRSTIMEIEEEEVEFTEVGISNGCEGCLFNNEEHSPRILPCRKPDSITPCVGVDGKMGIYSKK